FFVFAVVDRFFFSGEFAFPFGARFFAGGGSLPRACSFGARCFTAGGARSGGRGGEARGGFGDVALVDVADLRLGFDLRREARLGGLVVEARLAVDGRVTSLEHGVFFGQFLVSPVDLARRGGEAEGEDVEGDDPDQEHAEQADPGPAAGEAVDQ